MQWYENKNLRTYDTKTYQKTFTERKTTFCNSYIHYDNSIRKVGDGKGKFRKVDKTWKDDGTKFYFEYANDPVDAPKFANGMIKYKNLLSDLDVELILEPDCNQVSGSISGRDIVYSDAFDTGIDLILTPTMRGLRKLVRIDEAVKTSKDYVFRFKLTVKDLIDKDLKIFRVSKTDKSDYFEVKLDKKNKDFSDSNYYTIIGKTHTSGTIIPSPKAWDSPEVPNNPKSIDIGFKIEFDKGDPYFIKTIPQSFIDDSIGDVYTDIETTLTPTENAVRFNANNDEAASGTGEWADLFNNVGGTTTSVTGASTTNQSVVYQQVDGFGRKHVQNTRALMWWTITSLSGVTVSDATVTVVQDNGADPFNGDSSGYDYWVLTNSTAHSTGEYSSATEDYDGSEWYDTGPTEISDTVDMTVSFGQTMVFTLNATGISDLQNSIDNSHSEWGCFFTDGFSAQTTAPDPISGTGVIEQAFLRYEDNVSSGEPELTVTYNIETGLGGGIGMNTTITTS